MTKSHVFVLLTSLGFSFIAVFTMLLINCGVSILEQVFLRVNISVALLPLILRKKILIKMEDIFYFGCIGLVFSSFLLTGLSSLVFGAPIAIASALMYTQPIFTTLISHFTGKERINLRKLSIIFLGALGAFLATGITWKDVSVLKINTGVILALNAGFLYAIYLFLKRNKKKYTSIQMVFNTFLFSMPFIILFAVTLRNFTTDPHFIAFVIPNCYQLSLILLFATFSTILPYVFLNNVNPQEISPTTEGTMLLLDPVLSIIWAMLFFQQFLLPLQYFGIFMVIVVAAISLRI